ncbi:MAG: hypothetical protein A2W00_11230 [Candidatus Eisenbacteria bacterium RBG_16_71_46]|nr:MAG: hypothetical protein A2W00_11230 [Candidatus Eisenbacteria bacterium RBG_16_71_46]OGF22814.1 MAG: hypothetical protein A2V63_10540 [Candidatus Eisenbacteria bacterium RBG_19FT_COMBO_70_11]
MTCVQARRLFGPYWDDETTQAEREWLETHLVSCDPCRGAYEEFARAIELVGALPRLEAAPGLVERTLSRARRAQAAPDRLAVARPSWVPVTAAAAAVVLAAALVSTWIGGPSSPRTGERETATAVRQPELVRRDGDLAGNGGGTSVTPPPAGAMGEVAAAMPDSLFDHGADVEFILDPVALRRGHTSAESHLPAGVRATQAVISF